MANKVTIEIIVDDRGSATVKQFGAAAEDSFKKAESAGGGMGATLSKMWPAIASGAAAAVAGFYALKEAVAAPMQAYMASEAATFKLGMAMKNQGDFTRAALAELEAHAEAIQANTGYEDDMAKAMMGSLKSYGMTTEEVKKATQVALDFATAKASEGMTATTAGELLGKAYAGNTAMLSRYGIVIDESIPQAQRFDAAMKQLQQRFGGSAQAELMTYAGQWKHLQNIWGDIQEFLGLVLLKTLEGMLFTGGLLATTFMNAGSAILGIFRVITSPLTLVLEGFSKLAELAGLTKTADALHSIATATADAQKNIATAREGVVAWTAKQHDAMVATDKVAGSIDKLGIQGKRTQRDLEDSNAAITAAAKSSYEAQEKIVKNFYKTQEDEIKANEQVLKLSGASESEILRKRIEAQTGLVEQYYEKETGLIKMAADARSADDKKKLSDAAFISDKMRGLDDDLLVKRKEITNQMKVLAATEEAERRAETEKTLKATISAEDAMIKEIQEGTDKSIATIKTRTDERRKMERSLYSDLRGYEQDNYNAAVALIQSQAEEFRKAGIDEVAIASWVARETENAYIQMRRASDDWKGGVEAALLEIQQKQTTWGATTYDITKQAYDNAAKAFGTNFRDVVMGDYGNIGAAWKKLWDDALITFGEDIGKMIMEAAAKDIVLLFKSQWTSDSSAVLGLLNKAWGLGESLFSNAGGFDENVGDWAATFNASHYGGGLVPGAARYPGDHPSNDTHWARVSPQEYIEPRSAVNARTLPILNYIRTNRDVPPGYWTGGVVAPENIYGSISPGSIGSDAIRNNFLRLGMIPWAGYEPNYEDAEWIMRQQNMRFAYDQSADESALMMSMLSKYMDYQINPDAAAQFSTWGWSHPVYGVGFGPDVLNWMPIGPNRSRTFYRNGSFIDADIQPNKRWGGLGDIFTSAVGIGLGAAGIATGNPAVSAFMAGTYRLGASRGNWQSAALAAALAYLITPNNPGGDVLGVGMGGAGEAATSFSVYNNLLNALQVKGLDFAKSQILGMILGGGGGAGGSMSVSYAGTDDGGLLERLSALAMGLGPEGDFRFRALASGGKFRAGEPFWAGEEGRELIFPEGAGQVLNHKASTLYAAMNGGYIPGYAAGTIDPAMYANAVDYRRDVRRTYIAVEQQAEAEKNLARLTETLTDILSARLPNIDKNLEQSLAAAKESMTIVTTTLQTIGVGITTLTATVKEGDLALVSAVSNLAVSQAAAISQIAVSQAAAAKTTADALAASAAASDPIAELYHSILNRAPEAEGAAFYSAQLAAGKQISQIAAEMYDSPEYAAIKAARGYASGGSFSGGWRIVGEHGPELEYTGGSMIYPAVKDTAVSSEIRQLRAEMKIYQYAIAKNTAIVAKVLERWEGDGMPETRT